MTIDVPPEELWPWLVQIGCLRAGFYSNDLLDDLGRPSARTIIPELQKLEVGQSASMSFTSPDSWAGQGLVPFPASCSGDKIGCIARP